MENCGCSQSLRRQRKAPPPVLELMGEKWVGNRYCLDFDAPAANSRNTLRNPAAASSPDRASKSMVAARCGDSGRRRTFSKLCPRDVIRVFMIGGSSCCHCVEVVSTTGRDRDTVQLRE